ncbi:hypothetical protein GCM10011352_10630 [Marinobacterium zhoushanense]|uniref:SnoaL-like domain-containing protein n=1 Tax=Marinobacterium zhoushanense TaxID=1679163 RepID=A0ABQ1K4T5_9GAMM|nr:hypothetical protein [Marinobacterium zhoushanense]GGB86608.1 hypothetical protein GCM10011352_10630 [Marinobacterium zhoushanense]
MPTPADAITAYLHAKDGNRPHLMRRAFGADAKLEMQVNTGSISFPPLSEGREAISEVLVRRFGQTYENVYTFCLAEPPVERRETFACDWLVVMTEKESRAVRVGCGRYDWCFSSESGLVEQLRITIDVMQTLPPEWAENLTDWASALPYPWCSVEMAKAAAPEQEGLGAVFERLLPNA